jgi:hypothetical protein
MRSRYKHKMEEQHEGKRRSPAPRPACGAHRARPWSNVSRPQNFLTTVVNSMLEERVGQHEINLLAVRRI